MNFEIVGNRHRKNLGYEGLRPRTTFRSQLCEYASRCTNDQECNSSEGLTSTKRCVSALPAPAVIDPASAFQGPLAKAIWHKSNSKARPGVRGLKPPINYGHYLDRCNEHS
jgi:hypothetical protein